MSSAEAEYIAAAGCCGQVLLIKSQLADYDVLYDKVLIFFDNTSAIAISYNPVFHSRTKHIDIRYHFIRDHILKAGSESRPPMLNKENYVTWSSRLLRYAKSRPNGKLIHNAIINGPYVRRIIPEPGDTNHEVPMNETFHTILLGLPEDIYATVDNCETAQEIWLRVQQMMKGSDIGIQEKKAKLFNEWERFTSNEGELIESYYHRFLKLMNDLKQNKHFLEKIASNLKLLNNLQPEWSRHKEVDVLKAERLAKIQDPLTLMATSNNPYAFPAPHQDQPSYNQNYMQQPMPNPEDIIDPTTAMNMALVLIAKAFNSGLDLTYAPSTITTEQPTEGELDLLFEAMYGDYIGGQPIAATRTVTAAQEP
uniref:Retrovirus-related Pol polyprotein from transposon TNT 1-94 n=1 Tax=Tanacetum cinerariifolium TaxID=118510 RepID=A0A6L2K834_TANCI|nr:retrovirus-related Pol polyprotein from transposon TNT 1-94 [Tanacetum cinerariifolium]